MQHLLSFLAAVAAVNASPFPQGVTQAIAPPGGMPTGCAASHKGMFGIAVIPGTASLGVTQAADGQPAAATQISDGQPQAPAVNQISDGQVQAMTQIADGQVQAPLETCAASQISDGQVQGCMMPTPTGAAVTQISDGQLQAPTGAAVSQIGDGQPQAPTGAAVSQIGDGQPQAPTGAAASQIGDGQVQAGATAASQISDGQVQATGASQMGDGQVNSGAAGSGSGMTACMSDSTLELTLMDGILHDAKGRTGYIAANYQFQFDAPAQTGAIYTAGWSLCDGGVLALGMNTTFYRCRSGDFYNLYNENWAPQCEPVTIRAVDLVAC